MKRLIGFILFSIVFVLGTLAVTSATAAPSEARGRVTGTPACNPIITNTTWTVISSPYVVCGNGALSVAKGITLTVEPGVEVQFQANARLNVNGTLYAVGTSDQPITFTGVVTTPGSWQGIGIYGTLTETNRSVLDHVLIEYGGINLGSSAQLYLDHAAVTVTHSRIRHGQLHGIYGAAGGMANLDEVTFENNAGYAVMFSDGTVNPVLRRLTASGNGTDGVGLGGFAFLTGTYVWENSGVPYVMVGTSQVAIGSKLIIEPGVEVQFRQSQALRISGQLTAIGQPDRPITFTGSTKTIGWWGGLEVSGDLFHPASAQLDYTLIEYGGLGPNSGDLSVKEGRASVSHSIIRYGNTNGVYVNVRGTGSVIETSQIISHTDYGVKNIITGPAYAVNAANNWWGDPSGPQTDNSCNPGGTGSRITNNVIFRPVLTSSTALPIYVGPNDDRILTLSPRRWFTPADDATRVYFDIILRDGNGNPLPGRTIRLASTLGTIVDGGITDIHGHTLAYLKSNTAGDADVTAVVDDAAVCETARSPSSRITFTPPAAGLDLMPGAAAPYVNTDLQVFPMPVVRGIPSTIRGKLTNTGSTTITVDTTFAFMQSSIGLEFGPLAEITGTVIPANSSVYIDVPWIPLVSGHYCVQLIYTITSIGGRHIMAPNAPGGTSNPLNLNSYSAPLGSKREKAGLQAARDGISTINGFSGPGSAPFAIPQAAATILTGRQFDAAEKISQSMGFDPPRQDFNQIDVPAKPTFTPQQPGGGITAAEANALNALTASMMDVYYAGRAATITLDRYGGAAEAKDLQWSTIQANALLYYKQLMGTALITAALRLDEFHQVLIAEGKPDVIITAADVISYQQNLAANGFSAEVIAAAHQL
ncbi:MAG TPA: Ig-like domain-containing protein, partial [Anaerolineae bacterium]|nr:Ig-like domain-containing protein [Anaerolineae bacterium]